MLAQQQWPEPQAPFYARRRSLACVIGVHLPMSSALCVCIHASETGHAGGVPIAPSRGHSVEVPFAYFVVHIVLMGILILCLITYN